LVTILYALWAKWLHPDSRKCDRKWDEMSGWVDEWHLLLEEHEGTYIIEATGNTE
jgi:hypothetical protein